VYQCDNWPKGLDMGAQRCHTKSMKEILKSLPTLQLATLCEDLEIHGSTDEVFEVALTLLKGRADAPQWAAYYEV
jgi:hypothetical protein